MSVTVGVPRADDVPQPGDPGPQQGVAQRQRAVPVIPTQARPADPVSPVPGRPVAGASARASTPPLPTASVRATSGAYVGRVPPPMLTALPTVPKQRPVRGKPVRLPKRSPVYHYELSDIDDILASDMGVDREERRYQDRVLRHSAYKVLLGALGGVVVITVIAAFGVAGFINGLLSLLP